MKFESDTEIDRLLRRHARRESAAARGTGNDDSTAMARAGVAAHLDADEMNAYAEGALPDKTRARYVAHLADCDECRSLVTKLTLAANVVPASSAQEALAAASASRSWRDWLAALFAPQVLRYAAPALAILIIAVVVFVATRERREAGLVARNEEPQLSSRQTVPESQHDRQANTATATSNTSSSAPVGGSVANVDTAAKDAEPRRAEATEAASPSQKKEAEPTGSIVQSEAKPVEQQQIRDSASAAGQPQRDEDKNIALAKPAPAPPVDIVPATKSPSADEEASREEYRRKSADTTEKAKAGPPANSAGDNNYVLDGAASKTQAGARGAPASRARGRGNTSASAEVGSEAPGADAKDDRATETRIVSGRHFRRQGGAWVDTAYNASRSIVNVTRGSEQYRALVADEPGLRNIANQLGGTLIVVWKNRAYRIY